MNVLRCNNNDIGGSNHRLENIILYTWGTVEELCEDTECFIGNDSWLGAGNIIH